MSDRKNLLTTQDLRHFYEYARYFGYVGKRLASNLREAIRHWLAEPTPCAQFKIDARPPHEVHSLIREIEAEIRGRWSSKAAETRARKKRAATRAATQQQNPIPAKDPRQSTFL